MARGSVIKDGNVLVDGVFVRCDVRVADGRIAETGQNLEGELLLDAGGAYVLPGFIDLHTHGLCYESAVGGDLQIQSDAQASFGVTTFYPTLFAPPDVTAERMRSVLKETDNLKCLPQVAGFRLESPYLAIASGGTDGDLSPINSRTTQMLLAAGEGHVKIWDISPELEGAIDLIGELSRRGVVCSIAHTHASIELGARAVDAGARLATHLYDVYGPAEMTDPDPDISPVGLTDYLVVEDRVCCELIADGTHVHPILVEKALRAKTAGRAVFVTDSNVGSGLPPGRYTLPGGWGDILITDCNKGLRLPERGMALAGSALTMLDAFRNAVNMFGRSIEDASRLCSATPARLMGLNKGNLSAGMDADMVVLSRELDVLYTLSGGRIVFGPGL